MLLLRVIDSHEMIIAADVATKLAKSKLYCSLERVELGITLELVLVSNHYTISLDSFHFVSLESFILFWGINPSI